MRRWVRTVLGVIVFGALDLVLVGLLRVADNVVGAVIVGLALVCAVWATVRMGRSAIVVTPQGLVVRDTLRTHRLGWEQVDYFSPAVDDPAFRAIGVVTRDGRRLRCFAVGAMRFENASGPAFQRLHDRLEDHLQRARAQ